MRYTESANTERLVKYLDSLGAEKSEPRTMEYVWALIALVLFVGYLESSDVSQQVVQERVERACIAQYGPGERYAKPMQCTPMVAAPNTILSMPVSQ